MGRIRDRMRVGVPDARKAADCCEQRLVKNFGALPPSEEVPQGRSLDEAGTHVNSVCSSRTQRNQRVVLAVTLKPVAVERRAKIRLVPQLVRVRPSSMSTWAVVRNLV